MSATRSQRSARRSVAATASPPHAGDSPPARRPQPPAPLARPSPPGTPRRYRSVPHHPRRPPPPDCPRLNATPSAAPPPRLHDHWAPRSQASAPTEKPTAWVGAAWPAGTGRLQVGLPVAAQRAAPVLAPAVRWEGPARPGLPAPTFGSPQHRRHDAPNRDGCNFAVIPQTLRGPNEMRMIATVLSPSSSGHA